MPRTTQCTHHCRHPTRRILRAALHAPSSTCHTPHAARHTLHQPYAVWHAPAPDSFPRQFASCSKIKSAYIKSIKCCRKGRAAERGTLVRNAVRRAERVCGVWLWGVAVLPRVARGDGAGLPGAHGWGVRRAPPSPPRRGRPTCAQHPRTVTINGLAHHDGRAGPKHSGRRHVRAHQSRRGRRAEAAPFGAHAGPAPSGYRQSGQGAPSCCDATPGFSAARRARPHCASWVGHG